MARLGGSSTENRFPPAGALHAGRHRGFLLLFQQVIVVGLGLVVAASQIRQLLPGRGFRIQAPRYSPILDFSPTIAFSRFVISIWLACNWLCICCSGPLTSGSITVVVVALDGFAAFVFAAA